MDWKEFFKLQKVNIIVSILLIMLLLYFLTALEFVETLPERCGLTYPLHIHINCQFAHLLPWISIIILPLVILYSIISIIYKFKK